MKETAASAIDLLDLCWFDECSARDIVENSNVALSAPFTHRRLAAFLSELVNQSIGYQLDHLRKKSDWERLDNLAGKVLEYAELAENWVENGQFVPRILPKQIESIVATRRHLAVDFETKPGGIKRRINAWEDVFYPRILGLFAAAFGEEPKSYLRDEDETQGHSAVFFVAAVVRHVSLRQMEIGFDDIIRIDELKTTQWPILELRTIAGAIRDHKNRNHAKCPDDPLWKCFCDQYAMRTCLLKDL